MTHNGKDYQFHRQRLLDDIDSLIALEQKYMEFLLKATLQAASTLHTDFCRANDLIPFWIKYAPKQRGRKPTGTSIPWSEVGEKSLAPNLLLFDGPYYAKTPGLLIPGKDDKTKAEEDKRIRVRLDPLASLDGNDRCIKLIQQGDGWIEIPRKSLSFDQHQLGRLF